MIPWIFSINEFEKFSTFSSKKRQAIIDKQRANVEGQRRIIEQTTKQLKTSARAVTRRVKRNDKHRATEEMMSVSFDLKNSEPVLTNYVNSLLLLRIYQTMHIEGYVDPNALPEAMEDIDYGLYSVTTEDELRQILNQSTDPLKIIGIDLE